MVFPCQRVTQARRPKRGKDVEVMWEGCGNDVERLPETMWKALVYSPKTLWKSHGFQGPRPCGKRGLEAENLVESMAFEAQLPGCRGP